MKNLVFSFLSCLLVFGLLPTAHAQQYYLQTEARLNWWAAFESCARQGRQLVAITSAAEEAAIEQLIRNAGLAAENFWTSGTDQAAETVFVWFSTGEPFGYTDWSTGEPNNLNTENCVHIWQQNAQLSWNDLNCATAMFYICEDRPSIPHCGSKGVNLNIKL